MHIWSFRSDLVLLGVKCYLQINGLLYANNWHCSIVSNYRFMLWNRVVKPVFLRTINLFWKDCFAPRWAIYEVQPKWENIHLFGSFTVSLQLKNTKNLNLLVPSCEIHPHPISFIFHQDYSASNKLYWVYYLIFQMAANLNLFLDLIYLFNSF